MNSYQVDVPRDIEAEVVASLAQAGIKAQTIVPDDRGAGTIRISRTGGTTDDYQAQRDVAQLLIETWEENSVTAYQSAQHCYGALLALAKRGRFASGEPIYRAEIDPPRAYDDPQTPELYRVTFRAEFATTLETITINLED